MSYWRTYYEVSPPDDCTCRWINRSDSSGWEMVTRDDDCPIHGDWRGR